MRQSAQVVTSGLRVSKGAWQTSQAFLAESELLASWVGPRVGLGLDLAAALARLGGLLAGCPEGSGGL